MDYDTKKNGLPFRCDPAALFGKDDLTDLRYEKSALTIQRHFRGFLVRRERIAYIRRVVRVQACVRRWLAKRRLGELKVSAIDHSLSSSVCCSEKRARSIIGRT